jgi:hypothetical protein
MLTLPAPPPPWASCRFVSPQVTIRRMIFILSGLALDTVDVEK